MISQSAEIESRKRFDSGAGRGFRAGLLILCLLTLGAPSPARGDQIHEAVFKGDLNRVVALLTDHPELVEKKDKLGQTPLIVAANHNQLEIAELLLANGANVNARDPKMRTPLILALSVYHHDKMVRLLLAKGADVNLADASSMTALTFAVKQGQIDDAKILIANDANVNVASGFSPLYFAVLGHRAEMVELLLANGANVNYEMGGHTVVYWAKDTSDHKIEELLEKYGGHELLGAKSPGGDEIYKAVIKGDLNKVAALLKDHRDVLENRNSMGQTPLSEAVSHNQLEIAELLLANGADVNARDANGHTPLIQTMWVYNHDKMVRLLLAKGADVNMADKWSMTALCYAAKQGQIEDAKILIANHANVNFVQSILPGGTPLYFAVIGTHTEMAELLLANGADANHIVLGRTPLDYAKQVNYSTNQISDPKIEALLKKYGGHD
jgi:cytohesin